MPIQETLPGVIPTSEELAKAAAKQKANLMGQKMYKTEDIQKASTLFPNDPLGYGHFVGEMSNLNKAQKVASKTNIKKAPLRQNKSNTMSKPTDTLDDMVAQFEKAKAQAIREANVSKVPKPKAGRGNPRLAALVNKIAKGDVPGVIDEIANVNPSKVTVNDLLGKPNVNPSTVAKQKEIGKEILGALKGKTSSPTSVTSNKKVLDRIQESTMASNNSFQKIMDAKWEAYKNIERGRELELGRRAMRQFVEDLGIKPTPPKQAGKTTRLTPEDGAYYEAQRLLKNAEDYLADPKFTNPNKSANPSTKTTQASTTNIANPQAAANTPAVKSGAKNILPIITGLGVVGGLGALGYNYLTKNKAPDATINAPHPVKGTAGGGTAGGVNTQAKAANASNPPAPSQQGTPSSNPTVPSEINISADNASMVKEYGGNPNTVWTQQLINGKKEWVPTANPQFVGLGVDRLRYNNAMADAKKKYDEDMIKYNRDLDRYKNYQKDTLRYQQEMARVNAELTRAGRAPMQIINTSAGMTEPVKPDFTKIRDEHMDMNKISFNPDDYVKQVIAKDKEEAAALRLQELKNSGMIGQATAQQGGNIAKVEAGNTYVAFETKMAGKVKSEELVPYTTIKTGLVTDENKQLVAKMVQPYASGVLVAEKYINANGSVKVGATLNILNDNIATELDRISKITDVKKANEEYGKLIMKLNTVAAESNPTREDEKALRAWIYNKAQIIRGYREKLGK